MGLIVPDAVEQYLAGLNQLADPVLRELERDGKEQKLPLIDAEVGALLRVLATTIGAARILEIGTAIGYSGIWLAGALPPERDAADDGSQAGAGASRPRKLRAQRSRRPGQRHRRRRAADARRRSRGRST